MADTVTTTKEQDAPEEDEFPPHIKDLTASLREFGVAKDADWVEQHGLAALNSDMFLVHNIHWRPGFETVILTLRSIRNLLPTRYAPPRIMLRRADAPFRIAPIAGKGTGLLATRAIPPGVPVLVEPPSLVLPLLFPSMGAGAGWGWAEPPSPETAGYDPRDLPNHPFKALFARVDPPQQQALYALHNCKPPEMCGVEEGIMRTNALGIRMRVPEELKAFPQHRAVFLDLSRANHSCSPNLGVSWDIDSFTMTVFTLRAVTDGEELTISYVDEHLPRAKRQARLKEMYRFDCGCKACAKDGDARAKSDQRRADMLRLHDTLDPPALRARWEALAEAGGDRPAADGDVLKPLKTAYNLFVKEGMWGDEWMTLCADELMKYYMALGEHETAALWAKRAAQAYMVRYWDAEDKDERQELFNLMLTRRHQAAQQSASK